MCRSSPAVGPGATISRGLPDRRGGGRGKRGVWLFCIGGAYACRSSTTTLRTASSGASLVAFTERATRQACPPGEEKSVTAEALIPIAAGIFLLVLLGGGAAMAASPKPEFLGHPKGLYVLFF